MSWALASFAILAFALGLGFAWYERSHPSARVLALVGTLAALAALGRIAFAPIPNVKPTTDIVLISGYALGGAPGFAVGAIAALVSNFFFSQGPWTPWQMAAWGLAGIAGAVLARLTRRGLGRVPLAIACALVGLGFGAIMNFSTWVTFTGDHSLASYLTIAGAAVWFDVAHAVGNFVFALAFGPALVRSLARFRSRFEVTWRPLPAGAGIAASLLVVMLLAAPAVQAATPLDYVRRAQNADGGFGGAPGQASNGLHTGWVALGLIASGRNPRDIRRNGHSVIDYIRAHPRDINDVAEVERTILVLKASGLAPRLGSRDLVAELRRKQRSNGLVETVNRTAFAVFALRAAGLGTGAGPVRRAAHWIAAQQNRDGGFNFFRRGGGSGIDDTSAALQALVAAGRRRSAAVRRAVAFLRRSQNPDGGFPLQKNGPSNAQSAAWAVQALVAAGVDPARVRHNGSRSPLAYLRSLTGVDGAVRYSRTSRQTPVWVTAQVLTALARKPFPLARVPRARGARTAAPASRSENR